jgi:hypothetical protein
MGSHSAPSGSKPDGDYCGEDTTRFDLIRTQPWMPGRAAFEPLQQEPYGEPWPPSAEPLPPLPSRGSGHRHRQQRGRWRRPRVVIPVAVGALAVAGIIASALIPSSPAGHPPGNAVASGDVQACRMVRNELTQQYQYPPAYSDAAGIAVHSGLKQDITNLANYISPDGWPMLETSLAVADIDLISSICAADGVDGPWIGSLGLVAVLRPATRAENPAQWS